MEIITREQVQKEIEKLEELNTLKLKNEEKYKRLEEMGFEYREIGTSQKLAYSACSIAVLDVNSRKYLEDGEYLIYFTSSARLGNKGTLRRGYVKKVIDLALITDKALDCILDLERMSIFDSAFNYSFPTRFVYLDLDTFDVFASRFKHSENEYLHLYTVEAVNVWSDYTEEQLLKENGIEADAIQIILNSKELREAYCIIFDEYAESLSNCIDTDYIIDVICDTLYNYFEN